MTLIFLSASVSVKNPCFLPFSKIPDELLPSARVRTPSPCILSFFRYPSQQSPLACLKIPLPCILLCCHFPSYVLEFFHSQYPTPWIQFPTKSPLQKLPSSKWISPFPFFCPPYHSPSQYSFMPHFYTPRPYCLSFFHYPLQTTPKCTQTPYPCLLFSTKSPSQYSCSLQVSLPLPHEQFSLHSPSQRSPSSHIITPFPCRLPCIHSPLQMEPFLNLIALSFNGLFAAIVSSIILLSVSVTPFSNIFSSIFVTLLKGVSIQISESYLVICYLLPLLSQSTEERQLFYSVSQTGVPFVLSLSAIYGFLLKTTYLVGLGLESFSISKALKLQLLSHFCNPSYSFISSLIIFLERIDPFVQILLSEAFSSRIRLEDLPRTGLSTSCYAISALRLEGEECVEFSCSLILLTTRQAPMNCECIPQYCKI